MSHVDTDMPIRHTPRLLCTCGQEYSRDEHSRCPACGSEPEAESSPTSARDEAALTSNCDWTLVSRAAAPLSVTVGEPHPAAGHHSHLAEALHVRDTDAAIRAGVEPRADAVVDMPSFLAFVDALASAVRRDGCENPSTRDFLAAAAQSMRSAARDSHVSEKQGPPAAEPTWRDVARLLQAGVRTPLPSQQPPHA